MLKGRSVTPGKTLLFLDEIQACPKALDEVELPGEEGTPVQLLSLPLYAVGQLDRLLGAVFGSPGPAGWNR